MTDSMVLDIDAPLAICLCYISPIWPNNIDEYGEFQTISKGFNQVWYKGLVNTTSHYCYPPSYTFE